MASSKVHFGLDRELANKRAAKYSVEQEQALRVWIGAVTGEQLHGDFQEALKSGVALCNLINAIRPGSVRKISKSRMPFSQRENISGFLEGCKSLGMPHPDLFVTQDLFEGDNMHQVVLTLLALAKTARKASGFRGPFLDVLAGASSDAGVAVPASTRAAPKPKPAQQAAAPAAKKGPRRPPGPVPAAGASASSAAAPAAAAAAGGDSYPKFCGECGTKTTGSKFCGNCGHNLKA